jgi:type IV pilus assembly protein PilE
VELVIVLAILSLLLLVSIPGYQEQVRRTYRAVARAELQKVVLRQEQFFIQWQTYAATLGELGYPGDRYVLARDGRTFAEPVGEGIYLVSMTSEGESYELIASPLKADPRCGRLSLGGLGIRGASGRGGVADCW